MIFWIFWLNAMIFSTTPGRVSLVLKIYRIVNLHRRSDQPWSSLYSKTGHDPFWPLPTQKIQPKSPKLRQGISVPVRSASKNQPCTKPAKRTTCGTFLAIFCISESITDCITILGRLAAIMQQGRVSKRWIQRFAIIWASLIIMPNNQKTKLLLSRTRVRPRAQQPRTSSDGRAE